MSLATAKAQVYSDLNGLSGLRQMARTDKDAALKEVAKQFEGIFINMMLKSMRQANFGDPLFDSNNSQMYQDLYDQQLSLHLGQGGGLGLAESLVRQLGSSQTATTTSPILKMPETRIQARNVANNRMEELEKEGAVRKKEDLETSTTSSVIKAQQLAFLSQYDDALVTEAGKALHDLTQEVKQQRVEQQAKLPSSSETPATTIREKIDFSSAEKFVKSLLPLAKQHAKGLPIDAEVLLAQAALETGWGKAIIAQKGGASSYNLFNIKADKRWSGEKAVISTLEYEQGIAVKKKAAFRVYHSFSESFADYVQFLRNNSRYADALQETSAKGYLHALQKAGYATDPYYAQKILRVVDKTQELAGGQ